MATSGMNVMQCQKFMFLAGSTHFSLLVVAIHYFQETKVTVYWIASSQYCPHKLSVHNIVPVSYERRYSR